MRTLVAMALGMVIGISGVVFASDDFGGCSSNTHQAKNTADIVVKEQPAPASIDKANPDKVVVAQTTKAAQPAVEIKK